jgi:transcriptional regulator with XRE-family HTH domain
MKAGKTGVFEKHPNTQTIPFANKFVNLSAIARAQNIDHSYLSRIFAGKRTPSLMYCKKISAVLGMSIDEFLVALEIRAREVKEEESRVLQEHKDRIMREDLEDLKELAAGNIPAPRLPALRAVNSLTPRP